MIDWLFSLDCNSLKILLIAEAAYEAIHFKWDGGEVAKLNVSAIDFFYLQHDDYHITYIYKV